MKLEIRYAEQKDFKFLDFLQKANANDLSFYPKAVFEREIEKQRILLALVNAQHAGYLYHGNLMPYQPLRIHQACIEYDLRGNWYGAGLCGALEDMATLSSAKGILLRCGSDIKANSFWELMGYKCVDIKPGGAFRMRDINIWFKEIIPDLFPYPSITPSSKKQDRSIWRKSYSKSDHVRQSIMLRGKALLRYREELIQRMEDDTQDDGPRTTE
jgi:hypothetical protein